MEESVAQSTWQKAHKRFREKKLSDYLKSSTFLFLCFIIIYLLSYMYSSCLWVLPLILNRLNLFFTVELMHCEWFYILMIWNGEIGCIWINSIFIDFIWILFKFCFCCCFWNKCVLDFLFVICFVFVYYNFILLVNLLINLHRQLVAWFMLV